MKSINFKHMYLIAGAFVALVAIYIVLSILRQTHEGLSDGASTANDDTIAMSKKYDENTTKILTQLTSNPTSYINLLTSYKNKRMANAILETITNKNAESFKYITDFDEAIDYLKTLGVSDTATEDPTIDATVVDNNKSTSDLLIKLSADNQAYIELLTSYKKYQTVFVISTLAHNAGGPASVSDIEPMIDYLRTLGGISISTKPYVPTTRDISLST